MTFLRFAIVLGGLATLGPFSIDTYFPSFPAMAEHFGVSPAEVQRTLSVYLTTLAVMTLLHGPLADAFGRRRVVITALVAYSGTALACALAPTFGWLLAARAVQGLVAGAGTIVGRAIVRDLFEGPRAQQLMAQVTMVFAAAPAVAPVLGGYLHAGFGWRAPFLFLALLGAALAGSSVALLPETLPPADRQPLRPAPLAAAYLRIARDPAFLALVLSLALGFGGFLVYVASAADFVPNVLGLGTTEYGWLFVPIVVGLVTGSAAAGRGSRARRPQGTVRLGLTVMGAGALLNVALNLAPVPPLPWLVLPLPLYTFGLALQVPAVTIFALDRYPRRRGLAASVQAFVQTMSFALIASTLVPALMGLAGAYAAAMASLYAAAVVCWWAYRRLQNARPARLGR